MKTTNLLVLDDSLLVRELLHTELERDISIKVVAKAANAYEARDKIIEHRPDILVVDVMMAKMDGIEFVKKLLPQYSVPVIMISSNPAYKEESETIKNVTFIAKPAESGGYKMDLFVRRILAKTREFVHNEAEIFDIEKISRKVVAIGASTGGAEAIEFLLTKLPSVMPPLVIAQHMPPKFTKTFAERLNCVTKLSVKEARHGDILIPGMAYIAPGGYHTSIKRQDKKYVIHLKENTSGDKLCPCIDELFFSVETAAFGKNSVGVLLTGMGKDGSGGLLTMKKSGTKTIGQDKETSVIYGMPKMAYDIGAVDFQLPLGDIPDKIVELSK